ncbi:hypothetical protein ACIBH1_05400 [Nonomuraea sp. NPDC050663]|uniref:hypothetical protein n=1 Tax=Nonomuraea sp. NPDC050663 TaxID=3364370 RepID=UPI0037B681F5
MRKSAIILSAALLALAASGPLAASAASSAPKPVKTVGVCAKKVGGDLRLLEPKNLARSAYGSCRAGEKKVKLPTVEGLPKPVMVLPPKVQFKLGATVAVCALGAPVAGVPSYDCTPVVPTPSPTVSPTS